MTTLTRKLLATGIFLLGFTLICLPSAGLLYGFSWLLSFAVSVNFQSWVTHVVLWALAAVWTIYTLNTREGGELASKVITMKP